MSASLNFTIRIRNNKPSHAFCPQNPTALPFCLANIYITMGYYGSYSRCGGLTTAVVVVGACGSALFPPMSSPLKGLHHCYREVANADRQICSSMATAKLSMYAHFSLKFLSSYPNPPFFSLADYEQPRSAVFLKKHLHTHGLHWVSPSV